MTKHFILKKIEEYMDENLAGGLEFKELNSMEEETADLILTVIMTDFKTFIEHDDECNPGRSYNAQLN